MIATYDGDHKVAMKSLNKKKEKKNNNKGYMS